MKEISLMFHAMRIATDESIFGSIANYNFVRFDELQTALANLGKALDNLTPEQQRAFLTTFKALLQI